MSTRFETDAIRIQTPRSQNKEHSTPLYLTSSFVFDDAKEAEALFNDLQEGNVYSRFTNPSVREFELKMAALEKLDDTLATASGMAAIFVSIIGLLEQGDHLLVCRSIFGNTHKIVRDILPRYGISSTYVDINQAEVWEAAIQPNTKMIFVESPSNPKLDIIDLNWLSQLAKKHNVLTNVDNCMATPYLQQPASFGIDIVTHSATKFIDGQGRVLGGAIVSNNKIIEKLRKFNRPTGASLSPFNAWVLSKSLETLALRMDRHSANALAVAQYLENHNAVKRVYYPFLPSHPQYQLANRQMNTGGALVGFEMKNGKAADFLDNLKMISLTGNLGDTRSIATHPASTTHSRLNTEELQLAGITHSFIRISVGLEHIRDIIEDIEQAISL